jgi:hypothetical protein
VRYYVDKVARSNGDHLVHEFECPDLPVTENRFAVGEYATCEPAVAKAKHTFFSQSNGCPRCCPACHLR